MYRKSVGFQIFFLLILFQQLLTLSQGYGIPLSCRLLKTKYEKSLGLPPVAIPTEIVVPDGNKLHTCISAKGVQKYIFNGTAWNNVNVSAVLFKTHRAIGEHFFLSKMDKFGGQPTWVSFSPWSVVTSKILVKTLVTKDAIPWVLLRQTQLHGSLERFGNVTYMQRVFTIAGLAPNTSSSVPVSGQYFESPYSAVYGFYIKQ